MTLLIDNDALLKLARYDLLDTALASFGFGHDDVRVLATAKYVLLPAKNRLRRCKDEASAHRLEAFLAKVKTITSELADEDKVDALAAPPNIDPGEALMLAVAASTADAYVITGDKRALTALSEEEDLQAVHATLSGKVLSLEVLFTFLIEADFEEVQACVRRQPAVDKALTNAFGVSAPAPLLSVRAALDSYVEHLRRRTGTLLHPPPASS